MHMYVKFAKLQENDRRLLTDNFLVPKCNMFNSILSNYLPYLLNFTLRCVYGKNIDKRIHSNSISNSASMSQVSGD